MTFFGILRDSSFGLLLIGFSLLNVFYGLRIASTVRQRWAEFQREPLQPWQKNIIDRAAFFLGVPLGVFVHELAHALLIWFFGGRVVDFGYAFYFGYVAPDRGFPATEQWLISLAGTIGSLAYGVVMWLIFRRIPLSSYRYFAMRILRVHLSYSLIFYPLFTLFTFIGDWRIIYDFGSTPILSGITLIVHVGILALFWWTDRQGYFEMPGFNIAAEQEKYRELQQTAVLNPGEAKIQLQLINTYRYSGMPHTAKRELNQFLNSNPNSAEANLQLALVRSQNKRNVSKSAADAASRALALGLSEPGQVAVASQLVGHYNLEAGQVSMAIEQFSTGLAAAKSSEQPTLKAQLHYLRAMAYRRNQQYDPALADIQQAIELTRVSGDGQAMTRYEAELAAINHHAGRKSGFPPQQG
jgi:Tfp pilus assembly protein PilF